MSRWLFFPSSGLPSALNFSGTFDVAIGTGAGDNDIDWINPADGGLVLSFNMRDCTSVGCGFGFFFASSGNLATFVAAYPSDFTTITYTDSYNARVMTTKSGWTWDTAHFSGKRLYIPLADWNNWSNIDTGLIGETYSVTSSP